MEAKLEVSPQGESKLALRRERSVCGCSQWRDLFSSKHTVFYATVGQSVFHPSVKHTHAHVFAQDSHHNQTTLLCLVLR